MEWNHLLLTALACAGVVLAAGLLVGLFLPLRLRLTLAGPPLALVLCLGPWRFVPPAPQAAGAGSRAAGPAAAQTAPPTVSQVLQLWPALRPAWRYLRRRLVVRRLRLRAHLGGADAAETALLYGGAWAAWGACLAALASTVVLAPEAARLDLRPDFRRAGWQLQGECIVAVRAGQVIVAILILGWEGLRRGQFRRLLGLAGRKGVGRVGGASDSRPDEDGDGEPQRDGGRQHRGR